MGYESRVGSPYGFIQKRWFSEHISLKIEADCFEIKAETQVSYLVLVV
jgi:hypothetical protein